MREILFRGKDIRWAWHIGLLANIGNAWYISNKAGVATAFEVVPQTVGQYTGLTDKNGKKIFEDDIIIYNGTSKHEVIWDGYEWNLGGFYNSFMDDPTSAFSEGTSKMEIVGNIHDNPELWRGEGK